MPDGLPVEETKSPMAVLLEASGLHETAPDTYEGEHGKILLVPVVAQRPQGDHPAEFFGYRL
ncbi:MAG: hypothetical protein OXG37_03285 [Actinomycetia bacterium]|nr:hypothetical protein [Actinomycetes bacterium]